MVVTSGAVPERSLDQRLRALRAANEIRSGRAKLKQDLAAGRRSLDQIVACPPACARTAKVYDLLLALPKIGPAKATRWLSHCRIAATKTVTGLSERQRHELLVLLRS